MSDWRSLGGKSGRLISTLDLNRQGLNANTREGYLPLETQGGPTSYVISDNTGSTFSGTEDTYLLEGNPTGNFGSATTLVVKAFNTGDRAHTVIKFTGLASVPAGTVTNAKLRIYCETIGNDPFDYPTVQAYALRRTFNEAQATWNEYQTGSNWGTAGALNTTSDYDNALLGSIFVGAEGAWFEITGAGVDAYVEAVINGGTDYGVALFEANFAAPAGQFKEAVLTSSEGTNGQRPEITFDWAAGGGGPTIVDLTVATFSFIAQSIQNRRRVLPTAPTLNLTAQDVQNRRVVKPTSATTSFVAQAVEFVITTGATVVDLTAAAFSFVAQSIQNRSVVKPTSATLSFVAQSIQNRLRVLPTVASLSLVAQSIQNRRVVKPTTASLGFVAQSVQNRLLAKLTSANLNFTALAVEFVLNAGATVMDLTVATFSFVAQEVRNVRRVVLTSPTLNTTTQTVQNRLRATVTAASLTLSAQAVTVRRVITTTTASLVFTAQSVQNKLVVRTTTAILNFQGLAVEMFNVVVTVLVARARKSYSNYRRLLKQRRF